MKIRSEYGPLTIDFDPKQFKTKANAAKALHKALSKLAADMGMNADQEVHIWSPEQNDQGWRVSWEAGPYQWAVGASELVTGPWGYTEPYYSFDLCFTE